VPVLGEFRLTYLVPALVATTRQAIKVIIRGALIRGGAEEESSIQATDDHSIHCILILMSFKLKFGSRLKVEANPLC